jgi:hypothetical protein
MTGNWTIEFFIYKNPTFYVYLDKASPINPSITTSSMFSFTNSSLTMNGVFTGTYSSSPSSSTWNHYAIVFNGYEVLYFLNGSQISFNNTITLSLSYSNVSYNKVVTVPSATIFNYLGFAINSGYMGCLRISNTARYTSSYTVPTSAFTTDSNTVLLNNFSSSISTSVLTASDQANSASISSNFNLYNFFYITNGSAVLSTAQYKFGGQSLYIPSSSYIVLCGINTTPLWTIECWFYLTSLTTSQTLLASYDSSYVLSITYDTTSGCIIPYLGNGTSWSINSSYYTPYLVVPQEYGYGTVTPETSTIGNIYTLGNSGTISSLYLNGTTGGLQINNLGSAMASTTAWTVECWVFMAATPSGTRGTIFSSDTTSPVIWVNYSNSPQYQTYMNINGNFCIDPNLQHLVEGIWNHIAVTWDGSTYTLWVNGVSGTTYSYSTNLGSAWTAIILGQYGTSGNSYPNANTYYSSVRFSNICRYTSSFYPSTTYGQDYNTVFWIPLTGTNGSTTFNIYGSSTATFSATNASISTNAGIISTASSSSYLYFNSPSSFIYNGTFARMSSLPSALTSATTWTVEFWFYMASPPVWNTTVTLFSTYPTTTNYAQFAISATFLYNYSSVQGIYINLNASNGSSYTNYIANGGSNTTQVTPGWNHIAVGYGSSSTYTLWVNGVSQGTWTQPNIASSFSTIILGALFYTPTTLQNFATGCYMTSLRFSNNVRYTSAFTPSTSYTSDSNTIIFFPLTSGTNPSSGSVTIASATISSNQSLSYTGTLSSLYLNSGKLTISNLSSPITGASTWTIECWIYVASALSNLTGNIFSGPGATPTVVVSSSYSSSYAYISGKVNGNTFADGTSGRINLTWNHIALTFSGTVYTLWVNGINVNTYSSSTNYASTLTSLVLGSGSTQNIYFASLRVSNTARYTSVFNPDSTYGVDSSTAYFFPLTGSNGSTTFTESVVGTATYTASNASISTTQGIQGTTSTGTALYINNAYLTLSNLQPIITLLSTWTVEFWFYLNSLPAWNTNTFTYVSTQPSGSNNYTQFALSTFTDTSGTYMRISLGNGGSLNNYLNAKATTTQSTIGWNHCAVTYSYTASLSQTTYTLWVNGISNGTWNLTNSFVTSSFGTWILGAMYSYTSTVQNYANNCYMQNFRISGNVRYSSTFTPSTSYGYDNNTIIYVPLSTNSSSAGPVSITANTWHHLALEYNSSMYTLFIDGITDIQIPSTTSITVNDLIIGSQDTSYTNNMNSGYIDELYITNSIVHLTDFSVPTGEYAERPTTVQVLNHFNGTTLINSEDTHFIPQTVYTNSNPVLFYMPAYNTNGSTNISTSTNLYMPTNYNVNTGSTYSFSNTYSKFGSTSLYIPSSNYLSLFTPTVTYQQFTIDFWYNKLSGSPSNSICYIGNYQFYWSSNKITTNYGTTSSITYTVTAGTWYYMVLCVNQTNITAYINGTLVYTFTNANNYSSFNIPSITFYNGYFNNIRFSNASLPYLSTPTADYVYSQVQLSTAQYKFGSSSLLLSVCNSVSLSFLTASNNWTVEFWFYSTTLGTSYIINNSTFQIILNSTTLSLVISGTTTTSSSFSSILSVWNHLAIVYNSGTITVFLNGSSVASTSATITLGSLTLGNTYSGYIDELRISKYAVYTTSFTPPTSAFTVTTTCIVLNHFNGSNGFTALNYNDDVMTNFYNLTYETASNGNIYQNYNVVLSSAQAKWGSQSAYFDGVASYFTAIIPNTCANYTFQAWIYVTNLQTDMGIFGLQIPYSFFLVLQASTQKLLVYLGNNGTSWNINSSTTGSTIINLNTWYWISVKYAYGYTGNQWYTYVNGISDYNSSNSNGYNYNISNIVVGRMVDNQGNYNKNNFCGYIDDFSVASAPFTTTPTSALTRYTCTLLLNHFESTSLSSSEDTTTATQYVNPAALGYHYGTNTNSNYITYPYYVSTPLFSSYRGIPASYNAGSESCGIYNVDYNLFGSAWTLETWALWPSSAGTALSIQLGPLTLNQGSTTYGSNSASSTAGFTGLQLCNIFTSYYYASTSISIAPISFDTWNHFALTYDGVNTVKIFVNGTYYYTFNITIYASSWMAYASGGTYVFFNAFVGFTNGFRASNIVRYTGNYTVPTGFFTYDSNTTILFNLPNNAPKWGVRPDVYDLVLYPASNTYTSGNVTYYWVNNGTTIATTPSSILSNNTALFCSNSSNYTGLATSYATVVFSDYLMPGDWTMEMWFYVPTTINTNQCLFSFWFMGGEFIGTNVDYTLNNSAFGTLTVNTWYHFAACFDSINYVINHFVNGVATTTSITYSWGRGNFFEIHPLPYWVNLGCNSTSTNNFNGYIANFRISNCRRYFNTFTVSTSTFTRDMYTVILNPFNGTNGSTNLMTTENTNIVSYTNNTFSTYYSYSYTNGTYAANVSPLAYTTSYYPFSAAGGSLGIGNSQITIHGLANNDCQDSWTYELWFMLPNQVNTLNFIYPQSQLFDFYIQSVNSTTITINLFSQRGYDNNGNNSNYKNALIYTQNYSLSLNTWCHVAVSFDGNTYRMFMGGTLLYSNSYFNKQSRALWYNLVFGGSQYASTFGGYIAALRLSNTCRYTATFTPSTSAYTYDTNTIIANNFGPNLNKLEFYDIANQAVGISYDSHDTWYSYNNATLSNSQYKFGSQSLYLSGSNSYVRVYPGTLWYGSFTLQFWFNLSGYIGSENPYLITSAHSSQYSFAIYINKSTNYLTLVMANGLSTTNNVSWTSTTALSTSIWYHFAFCFDPVNTGYAYAYVNGVLNGTFISSGTTGVSNSITYNDTDYGFLKALVIGRQYITGASTSISTNSFNGYIDEFILSAYPRYNSTTAPSQTQKTRDQYDLVFNEFEGSTLIGSEATPVSYVYSPSYNYSFVDPYLSTKNNTSLTSAATIFGSTTSLSFLNDTNKSVSINGLVQLGSSWTIEFWCYIPTLYSAGAAVYTFYNAGYSGCIFIDNTYRINFGYYVWTQATSPLSITATPNAWNHIAIQFNLIQTQLEVFINGKCAFITTLITSGNYLGVTKPLFRNYSTYYNYIGAYYISELRISNILRYSTPSYTAPTTTFTIDSNTLVLNHFNGINGSNNLTWYKDDILLQNANLTFVTSPSGIYYINYGAEIVPSPAKYGSGALYVNNTYLILENMSITTTEWTIEMWYYTVQNSGTLIADYSGNYKLALIHNSVLYLYIGDGNGWNIINGLAGTTSVSLNTWHHIAIVYTGLYYYLYLDGTTQITTYTIPETLSFSFSSGASITNSNFIAISLTGQYVCYIQNPSGYIYYSSNYGNTFTQSNAPSRTWYCITCSQSSSTPIFYANDISGNFYTSTNNGSTWSSLGNLGQTIQHAINASGSTLVVPVYNGSSIQISTNSGSSFTSVSLGTSKPWEACCMSSNGQVIIVCTQDTSAIASISVNGGSTFSLLSSTNGIPAYPMRNGYVCMSSNGTYIYICTNGNLYMSSNTGQTFTQVSGLTNCTRPIISESGRTVLLTAGSSGYLYQSIDYGNTFTLASGPITTTYNLWANKNLQNIIAGGSTSTLLVGTCTGVN